MKQLAFALLLVLLIIPTVSHADEDADLRAAGFVELTDVAPNVILDMRYATTNNFTGAVVYPSARCYLKKPVAKAVGRIQKQLEAQNLGLKVYDCYRPFRVQLKFWELVPDERYVAKPKRAGDGTIIIGSRHNRGAAIDLTIVDAQGNELEMPTGFDDFTPNAKADYQGGSKESRHNRDMLIKTMATEGFTPYPTEWWHYDYPGYEEFDMIDLPLPN